ncbi:GDSL-type esterase/lipase family protein [Pedobacter rhodius]|uniref:GDSL-type esterase/lipase family protein n=1 Tax=Pedobacter rhodius TaxID=3004098 RepID=A0ABT4L2M9_9SPHI|nr:GDSL-type esterase/lipase family protein [Pedobacter sp. SJ11]MCZ4225435.1 GDSL-type esterase/lipase family protein [Pedobacter sp. SJ11]
MRKIILLITTLYFSILSIAAQTKPPFWDDVQTIKKYDQLFKPPVHPVLFVGSSSIRKWDNLTQVFAKYNALNRGIGGAVINDITFYLNDVVFPYEPRQIVLYVGENDIINDKVTADTVLNRTVALYKAIRAKLPVTPIAYISIKPSPSRDKFRDKAVASNELIKKFLAGEKNTSFIDIFPRMLQDGKSRSELFVDDMLHMNPDGYAIWEKAVKPYLIK